MQWKPHLRTLLDLDLRGERRGGDLHAAEKCGMAEEDEERWRRRMRSGGGGGRRGAVAAAMCSPSGGGRRGDGGSERTGDVRASASGGGRVRAWSPLEWTQQGRLVIAASTYQPPLQIDAFVGAARITSRPYCAICRGGCCAGARTRHCRSCSNASRP